MTQDLGGLLDSLDMAITSVAPDGTILFANATAARNLSCTPAEASGTSLYAHFPQHAAATRERIRQVLERRAVQKFEAFVNLPDGRERYFESSYHPQFGPDGEADEIIAVQIVAHDVTRLRAPEHDKVREMWNAVSDDLSMTPLRLKAILDHSAIVTSVYDLNMKVRYMNRVSPGVDLDDVLGRTPLAWMAEASQRVFTDAFDRAVAQGEPVECEIQGASGQSHWYVRLAPLLFEGEVKQVLGCALDISEQRRLQIQVAQKHRLESLGTMARGVAHDFNNLLTAIMGNTDMARIWVREGRDADALFDEIGSAARRAADVCEQMLLYAGDDRRIEATVDVNGVLEEMGSLTRAAVTHNIEVAYRLADELPPARCSRAQLTQICLNLINNAADALEQNGGRIQVSTDLQSLADPLPDHLPAPPAPGEYVRITIDDTGPGLDETARRRIFDPFYSTKPGGHGLGLSVVYGILAACDGTIGVDAAPTQGMRMTVLLPVAASETEGRPASKQTPGRPRGPGLILVVDDETTVRRAVAMALRHAGYETLEAEDGDAALGLIQRHPKIRAVLLDVTMPKRDGYSTLRALRELGSDLPVLLSSGRPIDRERVGEDIEQLVKPYQISTLLEAIDDLLATPDQP